MNLYLKLLTLADGSVHPYSGQYVLSYDPESHLPGGEYDGGTLYTTYDRAKARRFENFEQAIQYRNQGPTCDCHRLRADGLPDRPLCAFDVEIAGENE